MSRRGRPRRACDGLGGVEEEARVRVLESPEPGVDGLDDAVVGHHGSAHQGRVGGEQARRPCLSGGTAQRGSGCSSPRSLGLTASDAVVRLTGARTRIAWGASRLRARRPWKPRARSELPTQRWPSSTTRWNAIAADLMQYSRRSAAEAEIWQE